MDTNKLTNEDYKNINVLLTNMSLEGFKGSNALGIGVLIQKVASMIVEEKKEDKENDKKK